MVFISPRRLLICASQECGLISFVNRADAIRAKEDVLNRLGGNIGMPNGQTVRIGFFRADSVPVAPAKGSNGTDASPPQESCTNQILSHFNPEW
jgi:protein JSN1